MEPILVVKQLNKVIDHKQILQDIHVRIQPGSITGLLGLNGAGKTTMLNILAGLTLSTSGSICVEGIDMTEEWVAAKSKIAYIPDNPILYDELSGWEYLEFYVDLFQVEEGRSRLKQSIWLMQLDFKLEDRIAVYSLGMRKKLALLACQLIQPKLLLLDEYFSGLDPVNLKWAKDTIRQYADQGNGVLLSTHQLDVVEKFCDEIILIHEGRMVESESLEFLLENDISLEDYFLQQFACEITGPSFGGS
ncbi:ABC transporter ATP-binding protein [Paenibacillus puerhi]|uniref:ABC transporter ATP-binding protein n=1 Tax=Paenibacillus puerhi TaxID=2692622 RepID=UPI001356D001|nr:ABC transporter ATP-binding protein [Paenibacillus puerhi]